MTVKEKVIEELKELCSDAEAEKKKLEDKIDTEELCRNGVTGGLFAQAAINACDKRIEEYRRQMSVVENSIKWFEQVMRLYHA